MLEKGGLRGHLIRTRPQRDGRSVRLDLTETGKKALADDPFETLVRAARALSPTARSSLGRVLERMVRHVARGVREVLLWHVPALPIPARGVVT